MDNDEYESTSPRPVFRVVRWVIPWVAFAIVVWALSGTWSDFQRAKQAADLVASTDVTVTASASASSSVATTVTGMVAVTRVDVTLLAQPAAGSQALATSAKGTTLTVLTKQGAWFRVKDPAGHIGWVPDDVQYLDVRLAPALPAKKKK
jgi:cytoskeletal protein RodZ